MPHSSLKKQPFDIREYKNTLRVKYRKLRTCFSFDERKIKDNAIFEHITSMPEYTKASLILCFVSMAEEIDTHRFIEKCLGEGKHVGVPYCIDGTRNMDFYKITSLDQLEVRTYGVLEPNPETAELITNFSDSICILPGLTFDKFGFRIGYGGGYYDRFLFNKFDGIAKIGICYKSCTRPKIVRGRYDVACDYIVTEIDIKKRKFSHSKKSHL